MYDENNQAEETKYEEHLRKKEKFNELAIMHTSTDDALKRRQREEKRARLESWLAIAGLGGAAYGTAILINKNPELAEFLSKLPGANRYAKKHDAAYKNSLGFGVKPTDLRSHYLDQSFGRSMISFISSLEELSPFGILKTLQLSNILEPLTDISRTPKDIHITGSALKSSSDYYDKLIKYASDGKYNLIDNDLKRGMVLRGSQLLRMNADGTLDEANPILKHARSVTSHVKMGESIAPNRLWNKFAAILDTNLGFNSYSKEQVGIIAGKSWTDLATKWTNAGFMHSMEIGYKTLDNPLGGVEELLRATGVGAIGADRGADGKIISDGIFDSELYRKIKSKLNLNLGTGGNYNLTTSKAVPKMVKNLVGKSVGLYVGYQAINQVLDFVTPDSSIWSDGLISGLTANYANLRIGAAKILADPFQRYKEAQENAADGSTSLLTLAGFPIASATAGASLAWYKRMKDSALEGIESASDIGAHRVHKYGFANSLASKLKLEDTSISKKWGFQGAVIGAAIALPFLPGALIGESSEELKKSYSGEKLEAYRANAGWLCLHPDTKVITTKKTYKASEIREGMYMYDRDGNRNIVEAVHSRHAEKEVMYEIQTYFNTADKLKLTEDHKVLTKDGWKHAKHLTTSDFLVLPSLQTDESITKLDIMDYIRKDAYIVSPVDSNSILYCPVKGVKRGPKYWEQRTHFPRYLECTYELGLFIGWFLAEGSLQKTADKSAIEVTFHESEIPFAEERAKYLSSILNIRKTTITIVNKGSLARRLRFSSDAFREFLLTFLYSTGDKEFPDLTNFPKEFLRGVIVGEMYGDGTISNTHLNTLNPTRSRVSIKSFRDSHTYGLRQLISNFNVFAAIYKDNNAFKLDFGTHWSKDVIKLGVYKELYEYETCNSVPSENVIFEDNRVYVKIKNITHEEYTGTVYDYTVKDRHEYLTCAGIVHNSGSQSYEGGHIKAFVPSRVARILSGARDEVRYDGDNDLKRKMDPIYSPLSYLKNPYQYEEMHQDDMPYPVWGMSVNYGSFLGKIYQGTVGEMIKPTVINPQFLEDSRLIRTNAIQGYREAIQADVGTENESAQYTYNKESAYSPLARLGSIANYFGVSGGDGEFPITTHAPTKERQMIDAGMMLAEQSPSSDPYSIAASQTYNALSDFTGLKGFTSSLVVNKLGYNPEDVRRQLARSGDSRSAATDFLDENVGDALGCFTPEMRVVTKKGYKEIQHIQIGDLVLSKGGVYRPVKNIFKREFTNITILELHITGIDVVIRLTPDHKLNFIINHNHQLIEMIKHKAVYLTSGDYLIHPLCDDSLNKLNKELLIYRYNNNLYLPLRDVEIKYYTGYIYDLEIDRNDTDNSRTVNDINYYVVEGIEFSNSGEFIRRIVPMSAGARVDDVNPMKNDQVSWLPSDPSKFHIDFSTGNSYGKIALGEDRLPKGYAEYHTELKGMDPEDFPLAHQYNILSDVASGSPEQLALKTHLLKAEQEGKLSDRERDMFYTTLTQEQAKRQRKQFSEYKTSEEFSQLSVGGKALNKLWEFAAHKAESPLETMTPFRPGAKFIHKRSAIEDYEMTMLHGPDTGIWTNPFSHFIRPAMNRSFDLITPGTHKPKHAEERDNVEEYFDKLEYLKARMHGRTNDVMRTTHGATATGILDTAGYNKFRSAVGDKQRDYVDTFTQKTDHSERRKILEMLPTDVAAGYKRIWENLDIAEKAKSRGADINEAVENSYIRSSMRHLLNSKYKDDRFATEIDQAVKESRQLGAMKGKDYDRRQDLLAKARELRLRDADREAVAYISARTGVPGQDWIGWDPRLKLDEIKLRTLKIGKADTYDYGFWDSDLQRNSRIIALDDEDEVTKSYNQIKSTMRSDTIRKNSIERSLFNNGIFARRVTLSEANQNNTELRIEE